MFVSILNYTTGEVLIKEVPKEFEELECKDILTNMGYKLKDISFMITDTLNVYITSNNYCNSLNLK